MVICIYHVEEVDMVTYLTAKDAKNLMRKGLTSMGEEQVKLIGGPQQGLIEKGIFDKIFKAATDTDRQNNHFIVTYDVLTDAEERFLQSLGYTVMVSNSQTRIQWARGKRDTYKTVKKNQENQLGSVLTAEEAHEIAVGDEDPRQSLMAKEVFSTIRLLAGLGQFQVRIGHSTELTPVEENYLRDMGYSVTRHHNACTIEWNHIWGKK